MPKKSTINQYKYDSTHCRSFHLKLNLESDSDIIKKLETVPSMQGYIKQLIRNDIARTCSVPVMTEEDKAKKKLLKKIDGYNIYFQTDDNGRMILSAYLNRKKMAEEIYTPVESEQINMCCTHLISIAKQNISRT